MSINLIDCESRSVTEQSDDRPTAGPGNTSTAGSVTTMARILEMPTAEAIELLEVMRALSDDIRLQLVHRLGDGQYHPCRPEEFDVGVHKSTLSHPFRVLREAGLTRTRLDGRNHHVQLR